MVDAENLVRALSAHPSHFDENGCLIWRGPRNPSGYGSTKICGKTISVHRAQAMLTFGELPPKIDVCHKCDNPPCHNPDHLFLGSRSENMKDAASKGRLRWQTNPPIGPAHPRAKFSEEDIKDVIFSSGSLSEMARKYRCSTDTISNIRRGKVWAKTVQKIRALIPKDQT